MTSTVGASDRQRIAVIGGVAAGPAAAAQAKRTDPEADVVLFEQGPRISYGACEMPYYVADWIEEAETMVMLSPEEFEASRGATVRVRHRVHAIHPEQRRLEVEDLTSGTVRTEPFDKFILGVGAEARLPEGIDPAVPNVFPVRRLEDAIAIKTYLQAHAVERAVVLGGGYIGVEMAEALRDRGLAVTILEPREGLLAEYVEDAALRQIVHEVVEQHGVAIRRAAATDLELDAGGTARAVRTEQGEAFPCELVIAAMGVVPNTALAVAAGVEVGATGALAVDATMQTSVPNVWACGDCVEVHRVIDGKKVHLPLSPVAFRTAHVAAKNAARCTPGEPARFPGVCMASGVKIFGLEVASVGLKLSEARDAGFDAFAVAFEGTSRVHIYPGAQPLHVRLVVERGSGRLLGGTLVGKEGAVLRADVLVPLVREGWTVDRIRDLDLIYAPPLAPSIDPLLRAVHQAMQKKGNRSDPMELKR